MPKIKTLCDYCNFSEETYVSEYEDTPRCSKCGDKNIKKQSIKAARLQGDYFGYEKDKKE